MSEEKLKLVDTHCHLTMEVFADDREHVIARALDAGVERILVPGIDIETSRMAVRLAAQYPQVFAAVGVHPHAAAGWDRQSAAALRYLIAMPKVVAVGEIGLDYFRNLATPAMQLACFREQLSIAAAADLPVVVHNRDAIDDVLAELLPWQAELSQASRSRPGVLHAYSAGAEEAARAVECDFYLGIAGPITFKKAEELRTLVYNLPVERLLIETDAPYLTPHPWRGRRNEPAHVEWVLRKVAEIRQIEPVSAARTISSNAETLFNWTDGHANGDLL